MSPFARFWHLRRRYVTFCKVFSTKLVMRKPPLLQVYKSGWFWHFTNSSLRRRYEDMSPFAKFSRQNCQWWKLPCYMNTKVGGFDISKISAWGEDMWDMSPFARFSLQNWQWGQLPCYKYTKVGDCDISQIPVWDEDMRYVTFSVI